MRPLSIPKESFEKYYAREGDGRRAGILAAGVYIYNRCFNFPETWAVFSWRHREIEWEMVLEGGRN